MQLAAEKSGWGKQETRQWIWDGIGGTPQFFDVCGDGGAGGSEGRASDIRRVDTALDAGTIVNPTTVKQQFEGAAVMGTSIAFYGEITATNGAIDQSNFDGFRIARMNVAPRETYVHIVESDAPPAGVGEPGLPPFAPAIYNAVFTATGKRIREMPLAKAGLA